MKHNIILNQIILRLSNDNSVSGILLMGSVAEGTATPNSDLDLLVIYKDNRFEVETIDGVMVELIYRTYERALQKLNEDSIDLYHYLGSKVLYDNDMKLQTLIQIAKEKFQNFRLSEKDRKALYHWLYSLRIKLQNSIINNDYIRTNYLTATNSWKLIEAVWAINNIPMPPSSTVLRNLSQIKTVPDKDWFNKLFSGNDDQKSKTMMSYIEWALPLLNDI